MRTPADVCQSDLANTYVMSCHLTKDDLYKAMREDLRIVCRGYRETADNGLWKARAEKYQDLFERAMAYLRTENNYCYVKLREVEES